MWWKAPKHEFPEEYDGRREARNTALALVLIPFVCCMGCFGPYPVAHKHGAIKDMTADIAPEGAKVTVESSFVFCPFLGDIFNAVGYWTVKGWTHGDYEKYMRSAGAKKTDDKNAIETVERGSGESFEQWLFEPGGTRVHFWIELNPL